MTVDEHGERVAAAAPEPAPPLPAALRERMRRGVRARVAAWSRDLPRGLRSAAPWAIVAGLVASAVAPVAWPLLTAAGGAAATAALLNQVGGVGGNYLAGLLDGVLTRLRGDRGAGADVDGLADALTSELLARLGGQGPESTGLRGDVAELLRAIGGVGVAIDAAVESGVAEVQQSLAEAFDNLASSFEDEFGWMVDQLTAAVAEIRVEQRRQTDLLEQLRRHMIVVRQRLAPRPPPQLVAQPTDRSDQDGDPDGDLGMADGPYLGLATYRETDAPWFFGREELTGTLLARLADRDSGAGALVVLGPSGSGKSSLLLAGLLPALQDGLLPVPGSQRWPQRVLTPGPHPVRELAATIAPLCHGRTGEIHDDLLVNGGRFAAYAREALRVTLGTTGGADPYGATASRRERQALPPPPAPRLVLVVDQFEELFTLCGEESERRAFIDALCAAAGTGARPALSGASEAARRPEPVARHALVVLGMRADFYARAAEYPALAPLLEQNVTVGPMNRAQLHRVIEEPARLCGVGIEPGLVDTLLRDVGVGISPAAGREPGPDAPAGGFPAGALPLLSHVLYSMWKHRQGPTLTLAGYLASGGVHGAVSESAERAYHELDEAGRARLRELLPRLVHIGDGTEDTRVRLSVTELGSGDDRSDVEAVLDGLARARLVTVHRDSVEITHEALLRAWPRLRAWIEENRADLLARQRLIDAARAWAREGRDPSGLYTGQRLSAARGALPRGGQAGTEAGSAVTLGPLEQEFIEASVKASTRRTRRRQLAAALASLLVLLVAALGPVAIQQYRRTQQTEAQSASRQIAAAADALRDTDPTAALRLSLAAYRTYATPQARASLYSSYATPHPTVLPGHTRRVISLAYLPDGRTLVSSSDDRTIRLWDVRDPNHPATRARLDRPTETTTAVSPDGHLLVGHARNTLTVWDITDPDHPVQRSSTSTAEARAASVAFSPDGRWVATGGEAGRLRLWDLADPEHPALAVTKVVDATEITALAFSPDGRTLATANRLGDHDDRSNIRLWDIADPHSPVLRETLPVASALALAFSPVGDVLVAGGSLGTVNAWTITGGWHAAALGNLGPVGGLPGAGTVTALSFRADGGFATSNTRGGVDIWDIRDNALHLTDSLPGAESTATVAFRPDGRGLAAGTDAGPIESWTVAVPAVPGVLPDEPTGAAYGYGGKLLVTHSADDSGPKGPDRLWDIHDPAHPVLAARLPAEWQLTAFLPDGRTLCSLDNTSTPAAYRLWDVSDPRHPVATATFPVTGEGLISNAGTADGRLFAEGTSENATVHLWDVSDRRHPVAGADILGSQLAEGLVFLGNHVLLVLGGTDDAFWNVSDPAHPARLGVLPAQLGSFLYSGAANHLAVTESTDLKSGKSFAQLWDLADPGAPKKAGQVPRAQGSSLSLLDDHTLAVAGTNEIVLWDVARPARPVPQATLAGHGKLGQLGASPNSQLLVAVDTATNELRVWRRDPGDRTEFTEFATLPGISGAQFSPDSANLATDLPSGGADAFIAGGTGVALWDLDPDRVYRDLCRERPGDLTIAEWKEYVPTLDRQRSCD